MSCRWQTPLPGSRYFLALLYRTGNAVMKFAFLHLETSPMRATCTAGLLIGQYSIFYWTNQRGQIISYHMKVKFEMQNFQSHTCIMIVVLPLWYCPIRNHVIKRLVSQQSGRKDTNHFPQCIASYGIYNLYRSDVVMWNMPNYIKCKIGMSSLCFITIDPHAHVWPPVHSVQDVPLEV